MKITKLALNKLYLLAFIMLFSLQANAECRYPSTIITNGNEYFKTDFFKTNYDKINRSCERSGAEEIIRSYIGGDGISSSYFGQHYNEIPSGCRVDSENSFISPEGINRHTNIYLKLKNRDMSVLGDESLKSDSASEKCILAALEILEIGLLQTNPSVLKASKQAKNSKTKNSTVESKQSQSANANSQDASNQDTTNNDTSSNTKPLTKAELKAQKAEQQAQQDEQDVQEAKKRSQDNQEKADQKRQGKRKIHDPNAEAHHCVLLDKSMRLFGGFMNTCGSKITVVSCNYKPVVKKGGFNFSSDFDCEKNQLGEYNINAGSTVTAHNHNTETVYLFACKAPAWPVDVEFVAGQGIKGRCHPGGSD